MASRSNLRFDISPELVAAMVAGVRAGEKAAQGTGLPGAAFR